MEIKPGLVRLTVFFAAVDGIVKRFAFSFYGFSPRSEKDDERA